jgi:hypothetical protein
MIIKALFAAIVLVAITCQAANAQSPAATGDSLTTVVGKWSGTFEGASSGKLELVLNQDSSQKLTGQVTVIAEDGNRYSADLKKVVWQTGKLIATYTDPNGGDVSFTGNYAKPNLKGTWQSDGGQATGIWQAAR